MARNEAYLNTSESEHHSQVLPLRMRSGKPKERVPDFNWMQAKAMSSLLTPLLLKKYYVFFLENFAWSSTVICREILLARACSRKQQGLWQKARGYGLAWSPTKVSQRSFFKGRIRGSMLVRKIGLRTPCGCLV